MRTSKVILLCIVLAYLSYVSKSDGSSLLKAISMKKQHLNGIQNVMKNKPLTVNTPFYHDTEWTTRVYGRIGPGAQTTLSYTATVCNLAELEAQNKFFEVSINLPMNTDPWKTSKGVARLEIHNTQTLADHSAALYTNYVLIPNTNIIDHFYPVIGFAAHVSDFPDGIMYLVVSTGKTGEAADFAIHIRMLTDCSNCQVSHDYFINIIEPPIPPPMSLRQYAALDSNTYSVQQFEYNQHFVKFCRAENQNNNHWGLIAVITATDARSGMSAFACYASDATYCVSGSPDNIIQDFMLPNSAYASIEWNPTGNNDLDAVISVLGYGGLDTDNHYRLTLMETQH